MDPCNDIINHLQSQFDFRLENNMLIAQLDDNLLNNLLKELFQVSNSQSFVIEDLPVEETMRSFFENPENYL